MPCNGWTNYATWSFVVKLDNNERLYSAIQTLLKRGILRDDLIETLRRSDQSGVNYAEIADSFIADYQSYMAAKEKREAAEAAERRSQTAGDHAAD